MNQKLHNRQLELEEEAFGRGKANILRKLRGGSALAEAGLEPGSEPSRKNNTPLFDNIISGEIKRTAQHIDNKTETVGNRARKIYSTLQYCGDALELATMTLKIIVERLSQMELETVGINTVSLGEEVGLACRHIFSTAQPARSTSSKKYSHIKNPTIPKWPEEKTIEIGLHLVSLALLDSHLLVEEAGISVPSRVRFNEPQNIAEGLMEAGAATPSWPPLVVPPLPWKTMESGGYHGKLSGYVTLVKNRKKITGFTYDACPEVFDAVSTLQNTPFQISSWLYTIFSNLWLPLLDSYVHGKHQNPTTAHPGRMVNLHNRQKVFLNINYDISNGKTELLKVGDDQKNTILNRILFLTRLHGEMESILEQEIYFVNYCDFRGRVYQKASILNPQGDDLTRSMLEFREGKRITDEKAKFWLKVHGANCYGKDKAPFDERLTWVDCNEEKIINLGCLQPHEFWELPSELETWWMEADKPWAFLAWAKEWADYRKNPQTHESHLPIEVDGSCNGYQHIAALVGSSILAGQVNLMPTDRPQDIYSVISNAANNQIKQYRLSDRKEILKYFKHCHELQSKTRSSKKAIPYTTLSYSERDDDEDAIDDSENFPGEKNKNTSETQQLKNIFLATYLKGDITRKYTKKLIMTYPYAASLLTMAKALRSVPDIFEAPTIPPVKEGLSPKKRREHNAYFKNLFEPAGVFPLSLELAKVIRHTIEKTFTELAPLMDWYGKLSRKIIKHSNFVQWKTPTGFKVIQKYFEDKTTQATILGRHYSIKVKTNKQKARKHASAFGANVIHSLDAAHLMRTVNTAYSRGITNFRMVHDSYATHAADMEMLSTILREEFVRLYQNDILAEIYEAAPEEAKETVKPFTRSDGFDIDEVKNAQYFFA